MPFAILLLDSNYLTSARYAPKKWNINYITITGLSESEQILWDVEYGQDWSSVDSELSKELVVVTRMLNTLEQFGYQLASSLVSTPRVTHKENQNNRECYVWTLQKSKIEPPALVPVIKVGVKNPPIIKKNKAIPEQLPPAGSHCNEYHRLQNSQQAIITSESELYMRPKSTDVVVDLISDEVVTDIYI